MKNDRNCGGNAPYPIYPMYPSMMPQMGMPVQYPIMQESNTIEQQLSNMNSQINSLERRVSNLENIVNNTNKYNNTNYQVM